MTYHSPAYDPLPLVRPLLDLLGGVEPSTAVAALDVVKTLFMHKNLLEITFSAATTSPPLFQDVLNAA